MEGERFSRSMSGHNLFWLCGLKVENALTLYSPFTHPFAMRMQQDVQIYIEVQMT